MYLRLGKQVALRQGLSPRVRGNHRFIKHLVLVLLHLEYGLSPRVRGNP